MLDWCQIREMPSPKVSLEPQPSILIKVNWTQVSKIQNPASGSWMIYVKNIKVKINATKFKDICLVPHSEHLSSIFTVKKKISCDQEGHVNGWTSNILIEASRAGLIFVMWSHERCRYASHVGMALLSNHFVFKLQWKNGSKFGHRTSINMMNKIIISYNILSWKGTTRIINS